MATCPCRSCTQSAPMDRLVLPGLAHLRRTAHGFASPVLSQMVHRYTSSSADVLSKWQAVLASDQTKQSNAASSNPALHTKEHMRQLMQDAIHIYKSEGAAAVLPDRITDVFMGAYSQLDTKQQRLTFFALLAQDFGVQRAEVDSAVQLWQDKAISRQGLSLELMYRLAEKLIAASQPLYLQLLLPISQHTAGIAFLVRLRADLLQLLQDEPGIPHSAALRSLSQDLRAALARWFSIGLLQLKRITWDDTPGHLLERVMCTEAVHRMQHMEELKRRLQQSDRRVFAFLHPSLPGEPLVVLHTAIMHHIPSSMQEVLPSSSSSPESSSQLCSNNATSSSDTTDCTGPSSSHSASQSIAQGTSSVGKGWRSSDEQSGTVACFYSISSGQLGLSGVDLGNFLIKKAAAMLLSELPQLKHLVTLSPIPGFRAWLITRLQQELAAETCGGRSAHSMGNSISTGPSSSSSDSSNTSSDSKQGGTASFLRQGEAEGLLKVADLAAMPGRFPVSLSDKSLIRSPINTVAAAAILLEWTTQHSWLDLLLSEQAVIQAVLQRLCVVYLLKERRRGFALDPVAHFHLKNGAFLWRINTRADLSKAGLDRSCGLMVNYKYVLSEVSANNQAYLVHQVIAADDQVKQLLD